VEVGVFQSSVSYVCCNPFVGGNLISLLYLATSLLAVDSFVDLRLRCSSLALRVRTKELLVPCKLLELVDAIKDCFVTES